MPIAINVAAAHQDTGNRMPAGPAAASSSTGGAANRGAAHHDQRELAHRHVQPCITSTRSSASTRSGHGAPFQRRPPPLSDDARRSVGERALGAAPDHGSLAHRQGKHARAGVASIGRKGESSYCDLEQDILVTAALTLCSAAPRPRSISVPQRQRQAVSREACATRRRGATEPTGAQNARGRRRVSQLARTGHDGRWQTCSVSSRGPSPPAEDRPHRSTSPDVSLSPCRSAFQLGRRPVCGSGLRLPGQEAAARSAARVCKRSWRMPVTPLRCLFAVS
jgi:hypothetical protein